MRGGFVDFKGNTGVFGLCIAHGGLAQRGMKLMLAPRLVAGSFGACRVFSVIWNDAISKDSSTAAATLWPQRGMKTALDRGSLVVPRGHFKPTPFWCFEPVCESGRTLYRHNAVLPSAARRESTRRNVWFLFCVHALRQKERYADTIFPLLRHRCPQGLGNRLCTHLLRPTRTGDSEERVPDSFQGSRRTAVLAVFSKSHACGHGVDGRLLEAGLAGAGGTLRVDSRQSVSGEEHSGAKDRRQRQPMACRVTGARSDQAEFRAAPRNSRTA